MKRLFLLISALSLFLLAACTAQQEVAQSGSDAADKPQIMVYRLPT